MKAAKWTTASKWKAREHGVERGCVEQVELVQAAGGDIVRVAMRKIVDDLDVVAQAEQEVRGVRADIAGAAGNKNACHGVERGASLGKPLFYAIRPGREVLGIPPKWATFEEGRRKRSVRRC